MRKPMSILMAAAMAAALLAGCSGQNAGTDSSTAAPGSQTAAPSASAENIEAPTDNAPTTAGGNSGVSLEGPGQTDAPTADEAAAQSDVTLRIGSLKGPTTMGLVHLMDSAEKGTARGSYEFTMVTDASELVAKIVSGDLDIALVPANMASILYQKTNQGVNALNINTLGVLYIITDDDSVKSIADLAGKTVYMTGKGTTPDYVFQHLLSASGLSSDDVAIEYKSEPTEVAAILKEQAGAIGLLPQPFVTVAMSQNENLKIALDLTAEWDAVSAGTEDGGSLVTGVTVVRSSLLEDETSAAAVRLFMDEHAESTAFANENLEEAAELVAYFEIIEKAQVAQKALPYCSIVCIEGDEMKEMLSGYLNVLSQQDPSSVGGQLPDDAFYYKR